MRLILTILAALALPAQADPLADLKQAETALSQANSSLAKRRVLGQTIRAYEAVMGEISGSIATLARKIRAQDRAIAAQTPRIKEHLSALARLGRLAEPLVLVGQGDPADTLRGMLLLEHVTKGANAQIAAVQRDREALTELHSEHAGLLAQLNTRRAQLAKVRSLLIAEANTGTNRAVPQIDPAALAALSAALTSSVPAIGADMPGLTPPLPAPVQGTVLRGFGTPDPAGVARPGLTIAAAPAALVTSPASATVRYTGSLDGYGQVVILEPAAQVLLVLAGLDTPLVQAGEIIETGHALGFLPDKSPPQPQGNTEFLRTPGDGSGQQSVKSLYIELRHEQQPVDPMGWFLYER